MRGLRWLGIVLTVAGCTTVGPDFVQPKAPVPARWQEIDNAVVKQEPAEQMPWWWLIKLWPSWLWFVLVMALFSLFFATRIFGNGPGALTPNYYRWSYGLTTLVFIVFPDALTQGFTGDDPNMKFYERIVDYMLVTSYSVFAVLLFDAVVDRVRAWRERFARRQPQ